MFLYNIVSGQLALLLLINDIPFTCYSIISSERREQSVRLSSHQSPLVEGSCMVSNNACRF